ncbi:right-handed parallel beta-helix repeat-containing protein [Aestuariivivens sediminicola]|uniref:right-handed parallel beta-helix repeat-containing protein n=1 Tax=Aestuariivivens sediminicola TaxID=2913560 RepID=UPI001F5A5224|nr:right-handed parallel beta-helix repeat-containing protein [Aestuariivivens sediminicola]
MKNLSISIIKVIMASLIRSLVWGVLILGQSPLLATNYYVHPTKGSDANNGLSQALAFRTLQKASEIVFKPGDTLFLACGQRYMGALNVSDIAGTQDHPIVVTGRVWDDEERTEPPIIDFKGHPNGVFLENVSFIRLSNLRLKGNGYAGADPNPSDMRCGVLVMNTGKQMMQHIDLTDLVIDAVYYENKGFQRGKDEVRTANGTQRYGWGIRVINRNDAIIKQVTISNCSVSNVAHTGIKLTGSSKNISDVAILNNSVTRTGGPGIQMSGVSSVYVAHNSVSHSGSTDDSRKWGRGSGLWTWGASHVLIEKNRFLHANGPGDSAGAHIDFNCDNIVLQYNLSAHNAGGFCEILGNNYNCAYRYNISINDGHRVKGIDGAFQEGKVLWLSGYQGRNKARKGPVNSYIYNNTIYTDADIVAKIAIDNTSRGICIANNIFYFEGPAKTVLGDQYKPDVLSDKSAKNVFFENNLFLNGSTWPVETGIEDAQPHFGNPQFVKKGGMALKDYMPQNVDLIKQKGIHIPLLPEDTIGVWPTLHLKEDILGNPVSGRPSLGAIEP